MSLQELQVQNAGGYQVIPSTLSGLVGSLNTNPDPVVEAEEPMDLPPEDFEEEHPRERTAGGLAASEGRIITMVVDRGAATGLAAIAKGDVADYKASPDEYDDLEKAVVAYMEETDMQMSPLMQLVLAILAIYAVKIPEALKARKIVQARERDEQAALIAKKQQELAEKASKSETKSDDGTAAEHTAE